MTKALGHRTAVRAAVAAAKRAHEMQAAYDAALRHKRAPSERREVREALEAARARAVRLILDPVCLSALAAVAGPFLPGDGARPGEDA